jgi:hypothetical protein
VDPKKKGFDEVVVSKMKMLIFNYKCGELKKTQIRG